MAVGADLPTLAALHRTFNDKAEQALTIRDDVDSGLESAVWTGRFSDDFRTAWEEYRSNLLTLNEALVGAAEDVKINHNNIAEATGEADRL